MSTEQITKSIRPVAICLIRCQDRILVGECTDSVKGEVFYRPLGGGVHFGEPAREAVIREIREEIGAALTEVHQIGVIENIFMFEGKKGHEIVLIFEARFANKELYDRTEWDTTAEPGWSRFVWKQVSDFQTGMAKLYPEGLLEFLLKQSPGALWGKEGNTLKQG